MFELQGWSFGTWQPGSWWPGTAVGCSANGANTASGGGDNHPNILVVSLKSSLLEIPLQLRVPKDDSADTPPLQPQVTTKSKGITNGPYVPSTLDEKAREMNGSMQKKQPTEHYPKTTTGLEKTMSTTHVTDDSSSEESVGRRSSPDQNGRTSRNHFRKSSIPLAPPFMVSAPGKVIVYGEHAVVHGKPAMAAAISLRSYLHVHTLTKSSRTVSLFFPDISLSHTWSIDALPWSTFQHPSKKRNYYDLVTALDHELVASLKPHTDAVSPDYPPHERRIHAHTATAFLYLFLSLGSPRSHSCIYSLRSAIPPGAGLGSSASVTVCLATALLLQAHALSGPHPDQPAPESATQLERINRWAFVGECCIHGNPSGIDNTVSTQGKAAVFQRTDYARPPSVRMLRRFPSLPLLLVNTMQVRSTATEVAKVARLREGHPEIADGVLEAIGRVTGSAERVIGRAEEDGAEGVSEGTIRHLGELMGINHGLLVALGVSHPKLERLRALVEQAGVGWTKLTGAGGGGCAITLLDPKGCGMDHSERETKGSEIDVPLMEKGPKMLENGVGGLTQLQRDLEAEGFEKFETILGGDGVGVLYPAVLHNGSEESQEGGEEIDQEKFLSVQGRDGVEKLVGVLGPGRGVREGWRFWTV